MKIMGQEITRDMMPNYTDFKNDPYRTYQLAQQQLANALASPMLQQIQSPTTTSQEIRSNQWN